MAELWREEWGEGIGGPEVIESGGLKCTLVKMDGLTKQLQRTGCLADNSCNFILSLKLPMCSDRREMKHIASLPLGCYCLVDPGFVLTLAGTAHMKTRPVMRGWIQGGFLINALGL